MEHGKQIIWQTESTLKTAKQSPIHPFPQSCRNKETCKSKDLQEEETSPKACGAHAERPPCPAVLKRKDPSHQDWRWNWARQPHLLPVQQPEPVRKGGRWHHQATLLWETGAPYANLTHSLSLCWTKRWLQDCCHSLGLHQQVLQPHYLSGRRQRQGLGEQRSTCCRRKSGERSSREPESAQVCGTWWNASEGPKETGGYGY